MSEHGHVSHDNFGMGILSIVLSIGGAIFTEQLTGEIIHWVSIIIGAVLVFLVQKTMHYFWDKYVTKTKKTDV